MKAMILAAGRGMRMRPLTDHIPKPLLSVAGKPLIVHHLIALATIGIQEIVINVSHLGNLIQTTLGDGQQYGVHIQYSVEPTALETGGGIYQALPLLGPAPFLIISADIWSAYPLQQLRDHALTGMAHLVMVDNPTYHQQGDFFLNTDGNLMLEGTPKLTYGNMGILHPNLFANHQAGIFPLVKVLQPAIAAGKITGEHYRGDWVNVGTEQEWKKLSERF